MSIMRIAAFSNGTSGGNPAGVSISQRLPDPATMQAIAADVGFSETAFAAPEGGVWRVRYFSPLSEVAFCGHATIALGAALALRHGDGTFLLRLNAASISVEGRRHGEVLQSALQSPPTRSEPAKASLVSAALRLFGWDAAVLDPSLPPARIHGGADHLLLALRTRAALAGMDYDLGEGRKLMDETGLVTIALVHAETPRTFHARNAFASGGVFEDPATGAAAAAIGGYLRDLGWPHGGSIEILQGEDMGAPSRIRAEISPEVGSSIRVSGSARIMTASEVWPLGSSHAHNVTGAA